jgi:3-oxoacyl-(acyl-carrier-protein) synthase
MGPSIGIAGIGAVCGAGRDTGSILHSFAEGIRNPAQTLPFETPITCPTFQATNDLPTLPGRYNNSRTLRLTMQAVQEALRGAGLHAMAPNARVGVCIGTTVACQLNSVPFYDAYRKGEQPPLDPVWNFLHANLGQAVGHLLNLSGPRMTIVNACSSGTDAIGVAASWIRAGLCDVAIAGGADELHRVALSGFWSLGVISSQPCAPFDRNRSGLNLGEGAGMLVLESEAHAEARGKRNSFAVAGFGSACDGHHLTAPHPEGRGLDSAIRIALAQAGVSAGQISFINAHGTATIDNDRAEGKVIARLFGTKAKVLSTKGYTGHALGGAGGLEAVFALLGLREKWIPRSAGFERQADDVPITPVTERTEIEGEYALSTSLAFGGNNAALVIRRTAGQSPVGEGTRLRCEDDVAQPRSAVIPQYGEMRSTFGRSQPRAAVPHAILGVGAVTPIGRDLAEIARNLLEPAASKDVRRVNDDLLSDPSISKRMRRADRFSRMGVVAALDAWRQAQPFCRNVAPERIGLIVTSGFGPHCRGFRLLDGMIDCGDNAASPTDFSHSVHGAPAAYITELLELRGPTMSNTDFEVGFEESVLLAQCWLEEGMCERVLVGAVEELGEVMLHCIDQMLPSKLRVVPGEGAVFIVLGPKELGGIASVQATPIPLSSPDRRAPAADDHFGRSASASAFHLLNALFSDPAKKTRVVGASCGLRETALLVTRNA